MKKCVVCSKNVLIPVTIGETEICKSCFLRIDGMFWKYKKYERYNDADSSRQKVISKANALNYPQEVINQIDLHFINQMNGMKVCDACKESAATSFDLGGATICKKCMEKVQTHEWKRVNYITREEVESDKNKTISIAQKMNFPENAIEGIEAYYNQKNGLDWQFTLDGAAGQILKVYKTYCSITTTDDFDYEEIQEDLADMEGEAQVLSQNEDDGLFTAKNLSQLASGVLKKGVIKGGVGFVATKAVSLMKDSYDEDRPKFKRKKSFSVVKGERKLPYSHYELTHYKDLDSDGLGYLRFCSLDAKHTEVMFFFKAGAKGRVLKEIKNACTAIMDNSVNLVKEGEKDRVPKPKAKSTAQISADILKYKELLDVGAITQEEYDAKKKQLLDI